MQQFHTRTEAITELHQWYICPECGTFTQPYRIKETAPPLSKTFTRTYTLACMHKFDTLPRRSRIFKAIQGGHCAEIFLTFETKEQDGHQSEHMTQWGRSFLQQYYQYLNMAQNGTYNVNGVGTVAVEDTGGTDRTFTNNLKNSGANTIFATLALATDNTYGIQVGTDATANILDQVSLNTLIANGAAATQLGYGSMGITAVSISTPVSYTWTRTLTNTSGAGITIQEAGMVFAAKDDAPGQRLLMMIRDLTGGVVVNNLANTTGTYTMSYTVA
jgi:hypothetical protein